MIEAVQKGIWRKDFVLHSSDGSLVELDVSTWREKAEFNLQDVPYQLYRESAFGDFVLERDGTVIARATKVSVFREAFHLDVNGHALTVKKISLWRRGFGVYDGEAMVGSVMPRHWYSSDSVIDLPDEWNLALQLFLFWLVLLMWKREAAAAAT
jgi:hypothetical protein